MTDMIERVAAAMWERTHDGRWYNWGDGQDESRIIHREDARVAIAAMREPTDAMLEAGNQTLRAFSCWCCWQAMIYAALRESNER